MKFTVVNSKLYGAKDAGYKFDDDAERHVDREVVSEQCKHMNGWEEERWLSKKLDAFCDFDSPLYMGEDGEYYAVDFCDGKPMIWQRIIHV